MDGHSVYSADHEAAKDAITHLMDATDAICDVVRFSAEQMRLLDRQRERISEHLDDCRRDL